MLLYILDRFYAYFSISFQAHSPINSYKNSTFLENEDILSSN